MAMPRISPRSDFYVTGGTLRRDAVSYVRRQADDDLYKGLQQGQFCYVLTSRQRGKSSLMVRAAARLREEGVHVAVLDLTAIGQNLSAEQWYDGLLGRIGQQLHLEDEIEDFWLDHERLGPLQRWMRAMTEIVLPKCAGRIVIFIDEIDCVRSLPFSTDEFFAGIREFYNRRSEEPQLERLIFCLIGVASPSDLIRDTRTTPFNISQRIELLDFTGAEAAPLAQGLGRDTAQSEALLRRVLYWTSGHPYLTQRMCQAIMNDNSIVDAQGVDRLCAAMFFVAQARERDDNLLFVRERILRSEADLAGLLDFYQRVRRRGHVPYEETNPLVGILRLSGLLHLESNHLKVRNRIYERVFDSQWVKENMPDAELRRQQAAYRKGLLRAAAIATLILLALGSLVFYSFRQRRFAEEQRGRAEKLLYAAHMNLVQQSWESAFIGRMDELLSAHLPASGQKGLGEDLRGFEWYYLWRFSHQYLLSLNLGQTSSVAVSPDETQLACASEDYSVKLWNATNGQELRALKGHSKRVWVVAFSPDGKMLASGSDDQTVKVWNAETGQELFTLKDHTGEIFAVAFSPDGRRLASGSWDRTVKIWDLTTGKALHTLKGHTDYLVAVAFSPDGRRLASGSWDRTVKVWNAETAQELLTLRDHTDKVRSVAFSPDGKMLASGSSDRTVKIRDAGTGKTIFTLKGHSGEIFTVAFSPDGTKLASGCSDRIVKVWNAVNGQEQLTLKGHTGYVSSVAFLSDGRRLASGSDDKTVKIWDTVTDQDQTTFKGHTGSVASVAFSPDGKRMATSSEDQTVRVWNVMNGQELLTLKGHTAYIASVAFSPDGRSVASGSDDHTVRVRDAMTGQELRVFNGHSEAVFAVAFSPDGKSLASGGHDKIVRVWDALSGQERFTLQGHTDDILSIAFSPDGKTLATGGHDRIVKLWDAVTGQQLHTLKGHAGYAASVAFSPDGRTLASASQDQTVKLWNVASGQELLTLKGHTDYVFSVAFSPDAKRLASGSWDGTVKLWDPGDGQELLTLREHSNLVRAVAFSPDGRRLASGSDDQTVKIRIAAEEETVRAAATK